MQFIDSFAGLGGFHLGLGDLGYECVFASEIDESLASLDKHNFGIKAAGDIRSIDPTSIPTHDVLCEHDPCLTAVISNIAWLRNLGPKGAMSLAAT